MRLIKELGLAAITTLLDANAFLPGFIAHYNARFAKSPQDPEPVWVPLPCDFGRSYYSLVRFSCSALSSFSGVTGNSVIHTPVALWIALTMAGIVDTWVPSPDSLAPKAPTGSSVSTEMEIISAGVSEAVGML